MGMTEPAKKPFTLTAKQQEAQKLLSGPATHLLLAGGSRSGKTALLVRNIVLRALKAPKSRHAIFRFRFNHVKASIGMDTFPKVMEMAYPGVKYTLSKEDWFARFENGSEIWFCGLDDKERADKVLGLEFATIYLNEASQIPHSSYEVAMTRLSQQCEQEIEGRKQPLINRLYVDCNPPNKLHWIYKLFVQKLDPTTKTPLANPDDYQWMRMNPSDNAENLAPDYITGVLGSLSGANRKRFLDGEFADANPNALFQGEWLDRWRVIDGRIPDMIRIVVAVDPSGASSSEGGNDAIGIVVAGIGTDGNGYLIEDCTLTAGPEVWGRVVASAYDRHQANTVVGETNYGGAMVNHVVQVARPRTPYKGVTASRGKHIRAEPIAALYEQGKVRHIGYFPELEEELAGFSTAGYTGSSSPNRADAAVFALAELFVAIVTPRKFEKMVHLPYTPADAAMGL